MSRLLDILLTPVALFGFIGAQVLAKMGKTEDLASTCVLYMAILGTGARSDEGRYHPWSHKFPFHGHLGDQG